LYRYYDLYRRLRLQFLVEWKRNVMAHAQKPDLVFQRNGRVHLYVYRRGCQFSRLLAAEVCASAVVMLDRPCSHTVHECWLPSPFASFPFTSPPVLCRVPSDSVSTLLLMMGAVTDRPDLATLEGSSCTDIMTCTGGCGYSF